jgi:hypothetical protein
MHCTSGRIHMRDAVTPVLSEPRSPMNGDGGASGYRKSLLSTCYRRQSRGEQSSAEQSNLGFEKIGGPRVETVGTTTAPTGETWTVPEARSLALAG